MTLPYDIEAVRREFPAAENMLYVDSAHQAPLAGHVVDIGANFARLRVFQQGNLHAYLLYVLAALVLGLTWAGVRGWWLP